MMDDITPNNDEVICPQCTHQFRAIPVNVQAEIAQLRKDAQRWQNHHDRQVELKRTLHNEYCKLRELKLCADAEVAQLRSIPSSPQPGQEQNLYFQLQNQLAETKRHNDEMWAMLTPEQRHALNLRWAEKEER